MKESVDQNYSINASRVKSAFNAAAEDYDAYSSLQQTVTERLIEAFETIKIEPEKILDLGTGTGRGSKLLKKQFKKAKVYQADLSLEMLKESRKQSSRFFSKNYFLCANASSVPLSDNSLDLVFSSLMLQWCNDLESVFAEVMRILKPGGLFIFTSFGPDTLSELRESWRKVDGDVHVNAFVDMHDIGDSLIRNGMDAPVLSVEHMIVSYDECKQLMKELKKIGAQNINSGRRKTLTGKQRLERAVKNYETYRRDNKLPATYEVIYGHAWKPKVSNDRFNDPNIQTVSLESLKQDLKKRK